MWHLIFEQSTVRAESASLFKFIVLSSCVITWRWVRRVWEVRGIELIWVFVMIDHMIIQLSKFVFIFCYVSFGLRFTNVDF